MATADARAAALVVTGGRGRDNECVLLPCLFDRCGLALLICSGATGDVCEDLTNLIDPFNMCVNYIYDLSSPDTLESLGRKFEDTSY